MNDVLSTLLETRFRGVAFPSETVSVKGGHVLALHRRMDRDGERVENTGRRGLQVTLRGMFINGLSRGPGETWPDELYPGQYRRLISALQDRTSGPLQHPIYGNLNVKVMDWSESLAPDARGGPLLEMVFVESTDTGDAAEVAVTGGSAGLLPSAAVIDASLALNSPDTLLELLAYGYESFSDFGRKLSEYESAGWLYHADFVSKADHVVGLAVRAQRTVARVDPLYPDAVQRFVAAVRSKTTAKQDGSRRVAAWSFNATVTLVSAARMLSNSVTDIVALNPKLAGRLAIPATTPVLYYEA